MMDEKLRECHRLVASVTEAISRVRSFRGKWAVLGAKLAGFETQLGEFSAELLASRLGSELVASVSETLAGALSLAGECENPSPVAGKLRTQSNVDTIAARIDRHVEDLRVLRGSGTIRDDGSRDLLTRLQIGDSESRVSAMDSLLDLLRDDESVVVAVRRGLVPILARLLDSSCSEIREKSVSAIARVAVVETCRRELVSEGSSLIGQLVRILESRSWFAKSKACVALHALSFSRENCREIGSKHGIASLLEICESGTPNSQAFSAGILRNLSTFPETKQNFMEIEDSIHVLISVAASGTWVAQEHAIGCLCNLISYSDSSSDEELMIFVAGEGLLEILMNFIDMAPSIESLEVAINLLKKLSTTKSIGEAIASLGFIEKLCGALSCGVTNVRISAAEALQKLGQFSKSKKEISEKAIMIIPDLVKMMEAKIVEEKSMAVKALSSILACGSNRKIFIEEERAIELTVELLDDPDMDKQLLISVLGLLSNSGTARKRMAAAGVFDRLRRLVEMEIDGAKKLYDNLDRSKTWGLFPRR